MRDALNGALERGFDKHHRWGEGSTASSGQRPGILLTSYNVQDSPPTKNYPAPKVNSAEVEKPKSKTVTAKEQRSRIQITT